ncbi:MAG: hypothetical protein AAF587_43895 [Bacteroidota bacterium]
MSASYLDQLFMKLADETRQEEIEQIQTEIWDLWMQSGEEEIDQLVEEGISNMNEQEFTQAIDIFSKVVELEPDFAEGWNKRATAYYLRGDFKTSLKDIVTTLKLEPRHFGALSGRASIYLAIGDIKRALRSLEQVLSLMPYEEDLQDQVEALRKKLEE